MKWKYKFIKATWGTMWAAENELSSLGMKGWNLVSSFLEPNHTIWFVLQRRYVRGQK